MTHKISACERICTLCQQTSRKRWFGTMNMTSNCDVTNSAHQIQITTTCHWMNPLWKFSAYATAEHCFTINWTFYPRKINVTPVRWHVVHERKKQCSGTFSSEANPGQKHHSGSTRRLYQSHWQNATVRGLHHWNFYLLLLWLTLSLLCNGSYAYVTMN